MKYLSRSRIVWALCGTIVLAATLLLWNEYLTAQNHAVKANLYSLRKLAQNRLPSRDCSAVPVLLPDCEIAKYFPNGVQRNVDSFWEQIVTDGKINDYWGTAIRFYIQERSNGECDYILLSAGRDRRFGTTDDLKVPL